MISRKTALVPVVFLLLLTGVPAQTSGDCVVMGNLAIYCHNMFVWSVEPVSGTPTTLFPPTCGFRRNDGATPAPLNDGILFPSLPDTLGKIQLYHCRRGSMSVLSTLPSQFTYIADILVDQRGDLIILADTTPAAQSGLYRFSASGGLLATLAAGLQGALAVEEDPSSGDFLAAMRAGDVVRVTAGGRVTTVASGALPSGASLSVANMHTEFATGRILVTWGKNVFRLDPGSGRTSTLLKSSVDLRGLDHDPVHGNYYRTDPRALVRFDPASSSAVQILQFNTVTLPADAATWGSRMLTGTARPARGAKYPITLAMPGEGGKGYQAAASFSTVPGIKTPWGHIHLEADPLFFLSLQVPSMFQGFSGILDASGTAHLTIHLPGHPALQGLRFFLAAVSIDTAGIRRISEPMGVTME